MTPPATAAAARRAQPAPAAPRRPARRRLSGALRPAPATPRLPARPVGVPRPGPRIDRDGLAAGLGRRLRELPDHPLLTRLIGGRVWIPLVAFLLLGLVTMQVSLLKLNAGIGRAVARQAVLARENAQLRASNGALGAGDRLRAAALAAGFRDPVAGTVRFLRHGRGDAALALSRMRAPSAATAVVASAATTPQLAASAPAVAATPVTPSAPPSVAPASATAPAPTTPLAAPAASAPATTPAPVAAAPAPAPTVPVAAGTGGGAAP